MSEVLERIGWVLIHFLWEGAVLGILAWAGLQFQKSSAAWIRYNFLCGCLLGCALAPILTWVWLGGSELERQTKLIPFSIAPSFTYRAIPGPPLNYIRLSWLLQQGLHIVTIGWAAIAAFHFFRTFCDYRQLGRLIASGRPIPKRQAAKRRYVARLTNLAQRMGIRRHVSLMECALLDVPSVVGWIKPIVLVPVAFLGSMPLDQTEAILAHELAHVRRCDYFVNLFQIVVESLLFYHPAVRWINYAIREERENCCDDIAVSLAGDKGVYVSALATLVERSVSHSAPAMAADGGSLVKRVRRVLGDQQSDEIWGVVLARQAFVGTLLGVLVIGLFSAISFTTEHSLVRRHVDKFYLTKALVAAAEEGDVSLMRSFLKQGADPNLNVDPTGENALFAATKHGQRAAMTFLLQEGASVNARDNSGSCPMDWVLATGNFPLAKILHDNGAKISRASWAAVTDDIDLLRSVAETGTLQAIETDEIVKCAVAMGHLDAVQFLENWMGQKIEGKFLTTAATAGDVPMMAYILRQGASIRTDGQVALEQAVLFYDQPKAAQYLLMHGADPNKLTYWNKYLLSGAQSAKMVVVLLEAGADPNSEDRWGTPLSAAADADSVRVLVQYGANLHPQLRDGVSLIESAANYDRHDRPDVLRELIRLGATFDPRGNGVGALTLAAARNKVQTMKLLLDEGVSPNAFLNAPFWKTSVMHSAVVASSIDAVKLLLEQGGEVLGDSRDGITPSALALLTGNEDMAVLLNEGGARDVGELSLAAAAGDLREVNDLIAEGADINRPDQAGHTPLFYALRFGQMDTVRLLLKDGAKNREEEFIPDSQ